MPADIPHCHWVKMFSALDSFFQRSDQVFLSAGNTHCTNSNITSSYSSKQHRTQSLDSDVSPVFIGSFFVFYAPKLGPRTKH